MSFKGRYRESSEFALSGLIYKHKSCEKCGKKHNEASMVLCDRCQDAYHIRCISLPSVPKDTWICASCQIDQARLKQQHLMRKRPKSTSDMQECRACKQRTRETFEFQLGEERVAFQARDVHLVRCSYCEQQFHNLCFSERPNSINCRTCEALIRESIPKSHEAFVNFSKESQMKVVEKNFMELNAQLRCPQAAEHCFPILQLAAPPYLREWRHAVSYEASLCYALLTRGMTYCQNLVVEMPKEKIETIIQAHRNSVEKLYRLHHTDEVEYEKFKANAEKRHLPPIEVREDRKKGFFLISTAPIATNTILAEYAGELITARESLNMISNDNIFTLIRNPRSMESLDIAPSQFANIAIFISGINNSARNPEDLENVRALKFCYKGVARLIFTAKRDIQTMETLYLNYNGDKAIAEYPTNNFVH